MINSNVIKKIEEDKHKCKIDQYGLEWLGQLAIAADTLDLFEENFYSEEDGWTDELSELIYDLKHEFESINDSEWGISSLQDFGQALQRYIGRVLKAANYLSPEQDADGAECMCEAYKTLHGRYGYYVEQAEKQKQKEEAA